VVPPTTTGARFRVFLLDDESINAFALLGGCRYSFRAGSDSTAESNWRGRGSRIAHILQRHQSRGADAQKTGALYQLLGLAVR
jgi:predicted Zn-dependent protease